jgi:hypothetical protein
MTTSRPTAQRAADARTVLERNGDGWLATAGPSGAAHLIAVSACWDGTAIVVATRGDSPTARNLDATRAARLALGAPDDAVLVDVVVTERREATGPGDEPATTFIANMGWDPGDEPGGWAYFRLEPRRIQAYRGYGERPGSDVLRDGVWLA